LSIDFIPMRYIKLVIVKTQEKVNHSTDLLALCFSFCILRLVILWLHSREK